MQLLRDLRFCLRSLKAHPSYAAGVIFTLALAYCAALGALAVNERVLLRPLPFHEPDRLALLWEKSPEYEGLLLPVSPGRFLDWRERGSMFSEVTAFSPETRDVAIFRQGIPLAAKAQSVFGNYFLVLGEKPLLGRVFRAEESWGGQAPVVMLGYRLWQRLGADPKIVGTNLLIDRVSYSVAGVMPSAFGPPLTNPDLWLPLKWWPDSRAEPYFKLARSLRVIARIQPGIPAAGAQSTFVSMAGRLAREQGDAAAGGSGIVAGSTPLHEWLAGDLKRPLLLMLGAGLVVLLIACTNVVHLSWVRTLARQEELAIRSALGAERKDVLRLVLLESLILSLAGGAVGVPLGLWGERFLASLSKGQVPFAEVQAGQGLTIALGMALSLAVGLGVGLATALLSARSQLAGPSSRLAMNRSGRQRGARLRSVLLVAESALAVVLLVLAGLLLRSFYSLARVDPGFRPANVTTGEISLPLGQYADDARAQDLFQRLIQEARHWPGVRAVGLADRLPLQGLRWTGNLAVEGEAQKATPPEFNHRVVSPDYFKALDVPILKGRPFSDEDGVGAPKVAIVNEALASKCCAGRELLGRRISFQGETGEDSGWIVVVGITANERLENLAQPPWPEVFQPLAQDPQRTLAVAVRSDLPVANVVGNLERTLRRLDSMLPLANPRSLNEILEGSTRQARLLAVLLVAFAATALALAAVGVFALTSFVVTERMREIGIRIALGASVREIRTLLLWGSMSRVLLGLLLGLCGAAAVARLLGGLLFEVKNLDPATYAAAALVLSMAALWATVLPAEKATRIDPARMVGRIG